VSFRLPSQQYDRLYERASRERVSIAEAVRRVVQDADRDEDR